MILRGGKQLEGPQGITNNAPLHDQNEHIENVEEEESTTYKEVMGEAVHKSDEAPKDPKIISPKPYTPPLPFPRRMAKAKLDL